MTDKIIFLDYASTTPVDPRVVDVMSHALSHDFANPSSTHLLGVQVKEKIENARSQVAALIHADSKEIIFTSGATESINLALKGAAQFYQRQGKHIITMSTEHKAGLDTCRYLETQGFEVTYLNPDKTGILNLDELKKAIRSDTILASIMHVNNETGVIQDIFSIGNMLREHGVLFHVDAAQSVGKLPIDIKKLSVDLMSLASHKIYGPKGVGALYVRRKPRLQLVMQMHGGDQENKLRSGTLATHQIVGMGEACAIAKNNVIVESARIAQLRDLFEKNIAALPGIHFNGDRKNRVCTCSNFQMDGIDPQALLTKLNSIIAISQGSACNAVDPEPSHVLTAMGLSRDEANRSFRVSFGRFTTEVHVQKACDFIAAR
jgi:cysteine desulfurase